MRHRRRQGRWSGAQSASPLLALLIAVSLLACSDPVVHAEDPKGKADVAAVVPAVVFSVTGDVPYGNEEERRLREILAGHDSRSEFLVHVGDIKRGKYKQCTEPRYKLVAEAIKSLEIPAFILPGDNEFNDCFKPKAAWMRWEKNLQGIETHWTLPFEVSHSEDRPENFAFVRGRVLFVGVSVVGGRLHDIEDWRARHRAALDWVSEQAGQRQENIDALVLFGHAHLVPHKHADVIIGLNEIAGWLKKPILYIHGDGHKWIQDRPFSSPDILRVQITRGGSEPPVTVEVYPGDKEPFRFRRSRAR